MISRTLFNRNFSNKLYFGFATKNFDLTIIGGGPGGTYLFLIIIIVLQATSLP